MEIRNITPMNTRPAFGMAFKAPDPQDMDNFVKALNVTFVKRENMNKLNDYRQILEEISTYDRMINLWNKYSNKNPYASNIQFDTIVTLLMKFMDSLEIN